MEKGMICPRCNTENRWSVLIQFHLDGKEWTSAESVLNAGGFPVLHSAYCNECGYGMHTDANDCWSPNYGGQESPRSERKEVLTEESAIAFLKSKLSQKAQEQQQEQEEEAPPSSIGEALKNIGI